MPTFVYELFETMQSSVTRSRTSITKSLPASFRLSIFALSSESYIKIHCFNKKDKLLINKLHSSVRDILPDFSITAGNNDMFDNDVCGDYSFQEVWDLLEKYNKTEVLREWKPDYTKRTINRRSKK